MNPSRIVFASFPLLVAACGGTTLEGTLWSPPEADAGGAGDAGHGALPSVSGPPCLTSADCAAGETCAWPTDEDLCIAFNPMGVCIRPILDACEAVVLEHGCGCDGKDVTWETGCIGLPVGYAPLGLAYVGPCAGGAPPSVDAGVPIILPEEPDASVVDAGDRPTATCGSDDCAVGQQCGFAIEAGCGATPQCLPAEEWGYCDSIEAACACSGETVTITGCASAASVPIASLGVCPGTDGGF